MLVNTGTPEDPSPSAVKDYLSRFLSDPCIVPLNPFVWKIILRLFVLPFRSRASAEKYQKIWTDEGFAFVSEMAELARKLQKYLCDRQCLLPVRYAMSYSHPLIEEVFDDLRSRGCQRLIVLPLYPQGAYSTVGAVKGGVERALESLSWSPELDLIDSYSFNERYCQAIADSILDAGFDPDGTDRLVLSFHSIPQVDIDNGDIYPKLVKDTCVRVAELLHLDSSRWTTTFQCRFDRGRAWLGPFARDVVKDEVENPASALFYSCPNFSIDCLETLFEVGYELMPRYRNLCRAKGIDDNDSRFIYVPCLNSSDAHVETLYSVLQPHIKDVL